jgi:hypothetical protein
MVTPSRGNVLKSVLRPTQLDRVRVRVQRVWSEYLYLHGDQTNGSAKLLQIALMIMSRRMRLVSNVAGMDVT